MVQKICSFKSRERPLRARGFKRPQARGGSLAGHCRICRNGEGRGEGDPSKGPNVSEHRRCVCEAVKLAQMSQGMSREWGVGSHGTQSSDRGLKC